MRSKKLDESHLAIQNERRFIRRVSLASSLGLLLAAISHLVIIRLFGDAQWLGTIVLFAPRWVLLPPLGLIAISNSIWRRRLLWVNLATGLLIVWPTMGLKIGRWEGSGATERSGDVTLMTSNIGYTSSERIRQEIERVRPDFVVLQESTTARAAEIFDDSWHLAGGHGVCIASRLPILETAAVSAQGVGRWSSPALAAQVQLPAGKCWLVGVHLETPRWGLEELALTRRGLEGIGELEVNTARRALESQVVRQWIDQLPGPVVVAGDFNMPVDSRIYGRDWSSFTNAFSQRGRGFGYTKFTRWHGIRIDHLLASDAWRITKAEVGNSLDGDHRPLIVTACLDEAP